jgi:hypothetical protein
MYPMERPSRHSDASFLLKVCVCASIIFIVSTLYKMKAKDVLMWYIN